MNENGGWQVVETARGDRHVIPVDDLRPHMPRAGCWCYPCLDDEVGDLYIHYAMDARE